MAGPGKPTWMPTWPDSDIGRSRLNGTIERSGLNRVIERSGLNSAIGRSGLNRAIKRSGLNHTIRRVKSHGVESVSWATIPLISCDPTTEITRSKIRVVGHDPQILHKLLYKWMFSPFVNLTLD